MEEFDQFNLAVIIPTFNRWEDTAICLDRLSRDLCEKKTVILVDDGSTDGTTQYCRERFPWVRILHGDGNLWWSGAINLGIKEALRIGADLVLWLNNDNEVEPQTINLLVSAYRRSALRSVICAENRSSVTNELEWQGEPPFWHPNAADWREEEAGRRTIVLKHPPGGRGVLVPSICFREVGIVDQEQFPHYWADHDFHYRAMARGYRYVLVRGATVWNRPNPPRFEGKKPFTLSWTWSYLASRRSPMNLLTLHRLWQRHLPSVKYRRIYAGYIRRTSYWIVTGIIARYVWLHRTLRHLRHFWQQKIS